MLTIAGSSNGSAEQTPWWVRDQLVGERTALTNQIRTILLERGHVVAQGRAKLATCLAGCSIRTRAHR